MAWLAGAVAVLAMYGLWMLGIDVASGLRRLWEWARRDRVTPLLEDPETTGVLCAGCAGFEHCDGREGACDCTCGWPEDWAEEELPPLPPERTWEEMTSHQLPVEPGSLDRGWALAVDAHALLAKDREWQVPWWEVQHRAAYEAMGFDYPSGLMARVRELTP